MHHDDSTAPCAEHCPLATSRRTFISQAVLAAAAAALAACGAGAVGDGATAPSSVGASLKVSDYSALAATGGIQVVTLSGARLAIVRTGASSFLALSLVCPHEGGSISPNGSGFLCSLHGARFSTTGTWTGGQRTTNMRSYATSYDATTDTLTVG